MPARKPSVSDASVKARTGRTWARWFRLLDAAGARGMDHAARARLLDARGVPGWWAQTVTVEYERARGLRAVGQRMAGDWEAGVQRTVDAPPARALAAFADARARARWMPAALRRPVGAAWKARRSSRTAMGRVVRLDLGRGGARKVELTFTPQGRRTAVRAQLRQLPSRAERDRARAAWGAALDALRAHLAAGAPGRRSS